MSRRIHIWAYPLGPGPGCRWVTLCGREVDAEFVESLQEQATCRVCLRRDQSVGGMARHQSNRRST